MYTHTIQLSRVYVYTYPCRYKHTPFGSCVAVIALGPAGSMSYIHVYIYIHPHIYMYTHIYVYTYS